ncbi:MAG TPA: AAA family ATPase [Stellaceae bacterium]|jgi:hypothetical protein
MPPDPIWAGTEIEDDTAPLRAQHRRSVGGDSEHPAALGEWDAGEDDGPIPPRRWLLGNSFCRRFLSGVLADGAVGKTALRITQLLSLATGRPLTGEHVFGRRRVLLISLEDDRDELRRRVRAAMLHHEIKPEEIKGWLFLATPKGMKLIEKSPTGAEQIGKLEGALRATIAKHDIDLVCLDPFVKAHGLEENDNSAIDRVCDLLAQIAIECDIAADAAHHVSKGPAAAGAGDANRGRGASAMKDAFRLVYTLTPMSKEEREQFGLSEAEARCLVRYDPAKVNIAPPPSEARWFRILGVPLGNPTDEYPSGDEVQAVEPWTPPDLWGHVPVAVANEILDRIERGNDKGQRFSGDPRAGEKRAAWRHVLARVPELTEAQCRKVIATWLASGVLETRSYDDPATRKQERGLFVNDGRRPG